MDRIIYLYPNQPQLKYKDQYFCKYTNFIDLFNELGHLNGKYRLIIPCQRVSDIDETVFKSIKLPKNTIEVTYYDNHWGSLKAAGFTVWPLRRRLASDLRGYQKVLFCGSGPNTLLSLLSYLLPKKVIFVFFVRGNRVATIRHYYKNRLTYPLALGFSKLIQRRMTDLIRQGRAYAFLYGSQLETQFEQGLRERVFTIYPLIQEHFLRTSRRPDISGTQPLKLLYVGRLSEEKNIWGLVKACQEYLARQQMQLTVIGDGPLSEAVQTYVKSANLTDHIRFKGYIGKESTLIAAYDSHDLLCLPSFTEGTPTVVIEAAARQLPVLATRVGSLPGLFPHDIKFLDGPEAPQIAAGIAWCNQNRALLSEMGRNCFTTIDRFLISKNAAKVNDILESI